MKTITLTRGLPASGKSTWAKEQVQNSKGSTVVITKDDLRLMFADTKSREKLVLKCRDSLTRLALAEGKNVIWADTGFNPIHEEAAKVIAKEYDAKVIINDSFVATPMSECIARDKLRSNAVGEKVIRTMYNQYLKPIETVLVQNENLNRCILVDIDGCLANKSPERGYYEWSKVNLDSVNEYVQNIVAGYKLLKPESKIIILSGRDGICKSETMQWLLDNNIPVDELLMRAVDDMRSDDIVKEEIYDNNIKDKYYVDFVIDDRMKVIRMWCKLGLNVVSCNPLATEF
jgi:predicted kinase